MKVDFGEAYRRLTRQSQPFVLEKKIAGIASLIDLLANEYLEIEINNIDHNLTNCDMLYFEYRYQELEEDIKFAVSLKRQMFLEQVKKSGYYGFTIYFDTQKIDKIESYSKWCENRKSVRKWKNAISSSRGFKKILDLEHYQIHFTFEKPH